MMPRPGGAARLATGQATMPWRDVAASHSAWAGTCFRQASYPCPVRPAGQQAGRPWCSPSPKTLLKVVEMMMHHNRSLIIIN